MKNYKLEIDVKVTWYAKLIIKVATLMKSIEIVKLFSSLTFYSIYYNGNKHSSCKLGQVIRNL